MPAREYLLDSKDEEESEGEVKKRNLKNHSYKVSTYTSPLSGRIEHKWITVIDITSLTYGKELEKQKIAASRRKHKKIEVFDPDETQWLH